MLALRGAALDTQGWRPARLLAIILAPAAELGSFSSQPAPARLRAAPRRGCRVWLGDTNEWFAGSRKLGISRVDLLRRNDAYTAHVWVPRAFLEVQGGPALPVATMEAPPEP